MPRVPRRQRLTRSYLAAITSQRVLLNPILFNEVDDLDSLIIQRMQMVNLIVLRKIRYLVVRNPVQRRGFITDVFTKPVEDGDIRRFIHKYRVTPDSFEFLLTLIRDHPVFSNNSNNVQTPVELQLAVDLYRTGRYGNGNGVLDTANAAGMSEGAIVLFSDRVTKAILSLEAEAMTKPTREEIEVEKEWVDDQNGCPSWRDGWCTGDGTLVPLFEKPSLNGDAYFSRKLRYDLNVQIVNTLSDLRIIDYVVGPTGAAHDASVFANSSIRTNPTWLFSENEFMWADSAYGISEHVIPVFKKPAADIPQNSLFNFAVSHLRIRSEHCMGALKGRWQSLKGIRIRINRKRQHKKACQWIRKCIILHNLVIRIEGEMWNMHYYDLGREDENQVLRGHIPMGVTGEESVALGEAKRRGLVHDYNLFRAACRELS